MRTKYAPNLESSGIVVELPVELFIISSFDKKDGSRIVLDGHLFYYNKKVISF